MITINESLLAKSQNLGVQMLKNRTNNAYVLSTLEKLGRLPHDFDGSWLLNFLDNESSTIRFLAVKNLGKLKNDAFLVFLTQVAKNDPDTNVRREAVSAIGRMRKPDTKKILFIKLKDSDPKVVCQAIRGLLVFKGEVEVDKKLISLITHENEMVQQVIRKEYFTDTKKEKAQVHTESYDHLIKIKIRQNKIIHIGLSYTQKMGINALKMSLKN